MFEKTVMSRYITREKAGGSGQSFFPAGKSMYTNVLPAGNMISCRQ